MSQYKIYKVNIIKSKLAIARFRPLDILVTGVTGAGKSTTLNSFFQKNVATVGTGVEPETMNLNSYSLNDSIRLWDTPGLGDSLEKDKEHAKKIIDLIYKKYVMDGKDYGWIDLIMVVIEGSTRDMGTTYKLLNEIIIPNFQKERVLIVVNQADFAMKGRHWDKINKLPKKELSVFLEEKVDSIQRRVMDATGIRVMRPIYYSAEYNYNIDVLFDFIIDNIPSSRRNLFLS